MWSLSAVNVFYIESSTGVRRRTHERDDARALARGPTGVCVCACVQIRMNIASACIQMYIHYFKCTLTVVATAIPAATVDRLKVSALARRLVGLISVAVTSAATCRSTAAVIDDGRQQFRTSWRRGRIVINANARAPTYLKALAGARTPVGPGRPATPCAPTSVEAMSGDANANVLHQTQAATAAAANIKCKMCGNGNVS